MTAGPSHIVRGLGQPCRDKADAALDIGVAALAAIFAGDDRMSAEEWANFSITRANEALDRIEVLVPGIRERVRGRG